MAIFDDKVQQHTNSWPPIPLIMWHRKAMDKEIVKAMATKFSEIFAISMFKKHREFCRRGIWMPHSPSKIIQIHMPHPVCSIM